MTIMHVRRLLPRRITLRARLTMIYGGLFFAAGIVLLGSTFALFHQQLESGNVKFSATTLEKKGSASQDKSSPTTIGAEPNEKSRNITVYADGKTLSGADAEKFLKNEQSTIRHAATTSLITQGGIALLIVGGVAVAFGWLIAGRTLTPLHQVTATARRIAAAPVAERSLHERIPLDGPDDEVKDLASAFNTMVERLDGSFAGQRRFVANASHELRTPLTLSRAMLELAMHRTGASEDLRQLGGDLLEINARHEQLISGLLMLASSENELLERSPVDLADVIDHVVGTTAAEAESAQVIVHDKADESITSGDALLLEQLVQNLVENGIRHNVRGGWVRIVSGRRGNDIALEVSNTGPTVSPYELPALFEPFRRLNGDRLVTAKGNGLGLSIVRSVAEVHLGEVTAVPRDGGGLVVTVRLPAES